MTYESVYVPKPILAYSEDQERATIFAPHQEEEEGGDQDFFSMPPRKRGRKSKSKRSSGRGRGRGRGAKSLRLNKGRLSLKIKGFVGKHTIPASQLIRFVPLKNIRSAAKKVLSRAGAQRTRRKGSKRGGGGRKRGSRSKKTASNDTFLTY